MKRLPLDTIHGLVYYQSFAGVVHEVQHVINVFFKLMISLIILLVVDTLPMRNMKS